MISKLGCRIIRTFSRGKVEDFRLTSVHLSTAAVTKICTKSFICDVLQKTEPSLLSASLDSSNERSKLQEDL